MYQQHTLDVGRVQMETLGNEAHGSHTEYLITFVNRGQFTFEHRERMEVSDNMFTLIPPGMAHRVTSGSNLDIWWISFCSSCLNLPETLPIMKSFRQVRLGALPVLQLDDDRLPMLNFIVEEMLRLKQQDAIVDLDISRSLLILLLAEIQQCSPITARNKGTSAKVLNALDFIQQHFLQPISLKDVAKASHCSPSYLATKMKQETGFSVGEWIVRNRLTFACSQLLHTDIAVAQLGEKLGWGDTTHFIRQFKKAFNQTPAAWRKAAKTTPSQSKL